jgi:hypothetical protein
LQGERDGNEKEMDNEKEGVGRERGDVHRLSAITFPDRMALGLSAHFL